MTSRLCADRPQSLCLEIDRATSAIADAQHHWNYAGGLSRDASDSQQQVLPSRCSALDSSRDCQCRAHCPLLWPGRVTAVSANAYQRGPGVGTRNAGVGRPWHQAARAPLAIEAGSSEYVAYLRSPGQGPVCRCDKTHSHAQQLPFITPLAAGDLSLSSTSLSPRPRTVCKRALRLQA